jgi:hypothetical protein
MIYYLLSDDHNRIGGVMISVLTLSQFNQYQQNKHLLNKMKTTSYVNGYPDPGSRHGQNVIGVKH